MSVHNDESRTEKSTDKPIYPLRPMVIANPIGNPTAYITPYKGNHLIEPDGVERDVSIDDVHVVVVKFSGGGQPVMIDANTVEGSTKILAGRAEEIDLTDV